MFSYYGRVFVIKVLRFSCWKSIFVSLCCCEHLPVLVHHFTLVCSEAGTLQHQLCVAVITCINDFYWVNQLNGGVVSFTIKKNSEI